MGDGTPAAYTVNYLDKDSGEVLRAAKVSVGTDGESITPEAETISITGYEYSDADQDTLTLSASAPDNNVLNLYYQKEKQTPKLQISDWSYPAAGYPRSCI